MEINGHVLPPGTEGALSQWTSTAPGESAPLVAPDDLQGVWLASQQMAGSSILVLSGSLVLLSGGGMNTAWSVDEVQAWPESPTMVRLSIRSGEIRQVAFADQTSASAFGATLAAIQGARQAGRTFSSIPAARVCTSQELGGHRVRTSLGLVSDQVAASAWVAQGSSGLANATWGLRLQAAALGANAIVAVTVQEFSGKVLLTGTAVLVEPV